MVSAVPDRFRWHTRTAFGRRAGWPFSLAFWFTSVPNEFLESYFPLRIAAYESIADSGGAGLHRGGNGVTTAYEFLEPGQISIHDDRWLTYPWGVNGGLPGGRSNKLLVRKDGSREWLASKCDRIKVFEGDILYYNTWGGGGWGDPLKRPADKVALDCERGLVSIKGATRYGVVVREDYTVDEAGTEALRRKMGAERKEIPLFNRGGTIEDLKARCKAETSFDPPRQPEFSRWMRNMVKA